MKARRWIALGISTFVLLFTLITTISVAFNTYSAPVLGGSDQTIISDGDPSGQIALLDVTGPIIDTGEPGLFDTGGYDHAAFLTELDTAMTDRNVQGIILSVDTPGGGILESAEIHRAIVETKELTDKPVYVAMGGMAASGGYYIAAPTDRIFATPQTLTGSIGVIMSSYNVAELLDNIGIEEQVYKSGPYKDILSPTREPLEEEDEIIQAIVDEYYDEFVDVIAQGRDMEEDRVRELGDGRIYTGRQALEEGLVDDLGSLEDAISAMREELGSNYQVVSNDEFLNFGNLFGLTLQQLFGNDSPIKIDFNQPKPYYMYNHE